MAARLTEVVIDCADPRRVADFWAAVLGYEIGDTGQDGEVEIADRARSFPTLIFVPVPEAKTIKNRIHLDVNATGNDQATELERLLALGARRVDVGQSDDVSWIVLADPEGNEFCLLRGQVDAVA
jgi:predicted enzyme related to lactoylglutathione lyase